MELKYRYIASGFQTLILLIAPLMELKLSFRMSKSFRLFPLLIAPLMELKSNERQLKYLNYTLLIAPLMELKSAPSLRNTGPSYF